MACYAMFYEKGCQEKYLSLAGPPGFRGCRGSQRHCPLRDLLFLAIRAFDDSSQRGVVRETEKRQDGDKVPTTVLSEPQGLMLFQVVRGRIECNSGLRPKSWTNIAHDPSLDPTPFRAHRRRVVEIIVLPANRSERL